MKIKIGDQRESLGTWIWNILMWMCLIAALISLLSGCQSESGRRARLNREIQEAGVYTTPEYSKVLIYQSPVPQGDKIYYLHRPGSHASRIYFVENIHGEIVSLSVN